MNSCGSILCKWPLKIFDHKKGCSNSSSMNTEHSAIRGDHSILQNSLSSPCVRPLLTWSWLDRYFLLFPYHKWRNGSFKSAGHSYKCGCINIQTLTVQFRPQGDKQHLFQPLLNWMAHFLTTCYVDLGRSRWYCIYFLIHKMEMIAIYWTSGSVSEYVKVLEYFLKNR